VSSSEQAQRFFDAIARRYDRVYAPPAAESRARMRRVLHSLPRRSKILDLGVGTGRELSSLLDADHEVVGLDVSTEMLAICARRARPIAVVVGDLWQPLPFPDAAFDAVLALHGTLAHPPSEAACARAAAEVARVLRSGGVFVVEVPLPRWLDDACPGESEKRVRRAGERTAWIEDGVTGASILALLLGVEEWRRVLLPFFTVEMTGEEGEELFFVGTKG
jgi:ubiquinone/menaquinone biosynthesis C-methylase UbiE